MGNVFSSSIKPKKIYDLKGSTYKRFTEVTIENIKNKVPFKD